MIDYKQIYKLKVDDPDKYHEITFLKKEGNNLHAKLQVREGIFTKIRLDLVDPKNVKINENYHVLTKDSEIIRKITVLSEPEFNKNLQVVNFKATLFGEVKPNSKGMVNIIIPLTLRYIYL